jgi:DNA-binding Xre family transcriptional regulator
MKTIDTYDDFVNHWYPIYQDFLNWHEEYAGKVVDYYPCGHNELVIRLDDLQYIRFNWELNSIQLVQPANFEQNDNDESWKRNFAERLFRRMRVMHITQEELAKLTGISQVTISKYVNAKAMPNGINLSRLARVLECSVSELIDQL